MQRLLLKSRAARTLAVRRVTQDNQGKKTAGIDGVKAVGPMVRLLFVDQLRDFGTIRARPMRRVWIPKPGKAEQRALGIPVLFDRAHQALVKLALEPQWEARFEPDSYGFRPGRSCHEAIEAIFTDIGKKSKYVLDADLKGCFDNIDQTALLNKIDAPPLMRRAIKAWLRAGVMEGLDCSPTIHGTPQGAVVSPTLFNLYLRDQLKLELSGPKTLITHARTQAAHFLGYELVVLDNDQKHDQRGHRSINGQIGLKVPLEVVRAKCRPYLHHGKPSRRTERVVNTDFSIVAQFKAEYRGVVEYYQLAYNRHQFGRLKGVMQRSLTRTLARKFHISVPAVYRRYGTTLHTEHGPRKGLQVTIERGDDRPPLVAQRGGISLARRTTAVYLNDDPPSIWNSRRSEVVKRLLADTCEMCGSQEQVEVHHIRHLKDLRRSGRAERPAWVKQMAARRRKTLIVCRTCHEGIHAGRPTRQQDVHEGTGERIALKGA